MNTEQRTARIVRSWLEEGVTTLPDRVLDAVLDQVPATPQRRSGWRAWRSVRMNTYTRIAAAAAAVVVVAVIGYQFLPSVIGPGTPTPAPTVLPTPSLIARGTFKLYGTEVQLNAMRAGDGVTGTMAVDHEDGEFSVDLKCTRQTQDGVILLAGDITESTSPYARKGAREVLVLKPGSPVHGSYDSEGRPGGDVRPAASCAELLQQVIDTGTQTVIRVGGLEPIEGTVTFGP